MELNIIEDKKNKLVFEVEDLGHTFLNILKNELWNDNHVKIGTYSIRHPIISKPKFILETDGNENPRSALSSAIGRLKKTTEKLRKDFIREAR